LSEETTMYKYSEDDQTLVNDRVEQFRNQIDRYSDGKLSDDQFRPLRLMNGLYLQRHAYMLRVAIPYGLMSSDQLRMLAHIATTYDKGYGHFTTRQNIQFNWPELKAVPDILSELANVQMHSIQTSGNCIRNVTTDHLAGVASDEVEDPRPYCEILRQWSTLHPEFSFLPRKFKIAVTGATNDRAAILLHDLGFRLVRNEANELGVRVLVGGGMGRTPVIGKLLRSFVPPEDLLTYTEAILRVYNRYGRRDSTYKARIKILVVALGIKEFAKQVEAEWQQLRQTRSSLPLHEINRFKSHFVPSAYQGRAAWDDSLPKHQDSDPAFACWVKRNVLDHKVKGYRIVTLSLKAPTVASGDVTSDQMQAIADLADRFSLGQLRASHEQNLIFSDVQQGDLYALWQALQIHGLATPNIGTLNDIICCPGLDFCSLAKAEIITVTQRIQTRFYDLDYLNDLGPIKLKISGCVNACAHHHVGDIGILGLEKNGEQWYQLQLGGSAIEKVSLARSLGRAVPQAAVPDAVEAILSVYLEQRREDEPFIDTYRRIGSELFKERVYATD